MVQYSKRTFRCQVSNETQPWELFIFGKIKLKSWCKLLKCFEKIAPWFLPDFSWNQKPPWLGSVSFETWHPKVRFEYLTIFEGYLLAKIFQKQLFTFGKIKLKPWCKLLKCFKKIAPWFLPDFSRNQKPPWLGSVSFETWHAKVRFEY